LSGLSSQSTIGDISMKKLYISSVASVFALACIGVSSVAAHDLQGLVSERTGLEPEVRAKIDEINELRQQIAAELKEHPQDGQLEAVVQTSLKWPNKIVSVCFFDGSKVARDHVAKVAPLWVKSTSQQFDFGPPGNRRSCNSATPSDIRVSFRGSGYYSYVGNQAKFIDVNKQTLNLQGMDKTQFSPKDDGVILHEFGHSIGFEHEHQSPVANCDNEFNWTYLYTHMSGWSVAEVNRNMKQLSNTSSSMTGLLTTPFDRKSIMLYALSKDAFKDSKTAQCYIPTANNTLSKTDLQTAAVVYPVSLTQPPSPAGFPSALGTPYSDKVSKAVNRLKELVP
jgi:hypothetical protein